MAGGGPPIAAMRLSVHALARTAQTELRIENLSRVAPAPKSKQAPHAQLHHSCRGKNDLIADKAISENIGCLKNHFWIMS